MSYNKAVIIAVVIALALGAFGIKKGYDADDHAVKIDSTVAKHWKAQGELKTDLKKEHDWAVVELAKKATATDVDLAIAKLEVDKANESVVDKLAAELKNKASSQSVRDIAADLLDKADTRTVRRLARRVNKMNDRLVVVEGIVLPKPAPVVQTPPLAVKPAPVVLTPPPAVKPAPVVATPLTK